MNRWTLQGVMCKKIQITPKRLYSVLGKKFLPAAGYKGKFLQGSESAGQLPLPVTMNFESRIPAPLDLPRISVENWRSYQEFDIYLDSTEREG